MPRGKGVLRTQNPFLHLHLYSKFSWEGSIEPIHSGFPREVPLTRGLVFYPGKSCATWKASLPNVSPPSFAFRMALWQRTDRFLTWPFVQTFQLTKSVEVSQTLFSSVGTARTASTNHTSQSVYRSSRVRRFLYNV